MLPRDTGSFLAFQFGGGRGAYWAMLALAASCVLINVAILSAPLGYLAGRRIVTLVELAWATAPGDPNAEELPAEQGSASSAAMMRRAHS